MTDYSSPSSGQGVNRFIIWDSESTNYSHQDLVDNLNKLDRMIGIPPSTAWPPDEGVNGGIYKQIALLQAERKPIGEVWYWFRPDPSIPIPTGNVVCDGSLVLAANHDFPGFPSDFYLPNLLNHFVLGANPSTTPGTPANPAVNNSSGAPGLVTTSISGNAGDGGSHTNPVSITLPNHNHSLPTHQHSLTEHQHAYRHLHVITPDDSGITFTDYGIFELNTAAISAFHVAPHSDWDPVVEPPSGNTGHFVPHISHYHAIPGSTTTGQTVAFGGDDYTDLAGGGLTGAAGSGVTGDGGATTVSQNVVTLPAYTGLIPLMKIKYATTI